MLSLIRDIVAVEVSGYVGSVCECAQAIVSVRVVYVCFALAAGSQSLGKYASQSSRKHGGTAMQIKARGEVLARLLAMPAWVCMLANKHQMWNAIVADEPEKFFDILKTLFSIVPLLQVPNWMLRLHDAIVSVTTDASSQSLHLCAQHLAAVIARHVLRARSSSEVPAWALASPHRVLDILVQHHPSTAPLSTIPNFIGHMFLSEIATLEFLHLQRIAENRSYEKSLSPLEPESVRVHLLLNYDVGVADRENLHKKVHLLFNKVAQALRKHNSDSIPRWARLLAVRFLPESALPDWLTEQASGLLVHVLRSTPLKDAPDWLFAKLRQSLLLAVDPTENSFAQSTTNSKWRLNRTRKGTRLHAVQQRQTMRVRRDRQWDNVISIIATACAKSSKDGEEVPDWAKSEPMAVVRTMQIVNAGQVPEAWWVLRACQNRPVFELAKKKGVLRQPKNGLHVGMVVLCCYHGRVVTRITEVDLDHPREFFANAAGRHHDATFSFAHKRYYWCFYVGHLKEQLCTCERCAMTYSWCSI